MRFKQVFYQISFDSALKHWNSFVFGLALVYWQGSICLGHVDYKQCMFLGCFLANRFSSLQFWRFLGLKSLKRMEKVTKSQAQSSFNLFRLLKRSEIAAAERFFGLI